MAVTAHWIARNSAGTLEWRSALIAFRHNGEHLAEVMFRILQETGIVQKVSDEVEIIAACRI